MSDLLDRETRGRGGERACNSSSKTLILEDSSIRQRERERVSVLKDSRVMSISTYGLNWASRWCTREQDIPKGP